MWTYRIFVISAFILCAYTTNTSLPEQCKPKGESLCVYKCCPNGMVLKEMSTENKPCTLDNRSSNETSFLVLDSNTTHVNTIGNMKTLQMYYNPAKSIRDYIYVEEKNVPGIAQHNMSAIIMFFEDNYFKLYPLDEYCVDLFVDNQTVAIGFGIYFEPVPPSKAAALYFPFLLMSAISFFVSAFFYIFVLKLENRNNKKCFVGYTLSMGLAFLSLVFLQRVSGGFCECLGAFFLYCTISGFVWFTFLCLDLVLDIMYFEEGYEIKRLWISYLVASILIPVVIVIASTSSNSGGMPDVPDTFIKRYEYSNTGCLFKNTNNATFFTPTGMALIISALCICMSFYYIHHNDEKHMNHFPWLDKKSKYRYRSISCSLTWVILTLWMIEAGVNTIYERTLDSISVDLIEALQGIFALLIFVSDRYTRRELRNMFQRKTRTSESLETEITANFSPRPTENERTSLVNNGHPQD